MDGLSSSHGSSVSEGARLNADSDDKVTDQGGLTRIRIRKRVDRDLVYLERIERATMQYRARWVQWGDCRWGELRGQSSATRDSRRWATQDPS